MYIFLMFLHVPIHVYAHTFVLLIVLLDLFFTTCFAMSFLFITLSDSMPKTKYAVVLDFFFICYS